MVKRHNSLPLAARYEQTALSAVRLDSTPRHTSSIANKPRKRSERTSAAIESRDTQPYQTDGDGHNGHAPNGKNQSRPVRNGHDPDCRIETDQSRKTNITDDVRMLIRDHRLDEANGIVSTLLDQRIAAGDIDLGATALLLQHYDVVLSRQPPLSHIGTLPLRPNDQLYACFDQFIDLIRQQQSQVSELEAIIAELI